MADHLPLAITGAWADDGQEQLRLSVLAPGGGLHRYDGDLDIAVGALVHGETWAQAAEGAYDTRWLASLSMLRHLRSTSHGETFIRFAHEWNATWSPWRVRADEVSAFTASWARYRAMQLQVFPNARLVFCVARRSIASGFAWTDALPGPGQVDLLGVDYYIADTETRTHTAADFARHLDEIDEYGAPAGLGAHLAFAGRRGLPLAINEWSALAEAGPSTGFTAGISHFIADHAGSDPGHVLYDIPLSLPGASAAGDLGSHP